jgi:hypothetical protein
MYIGILLGAHPILHISRIRVNLKIMNGMGNKNQYIHVYFDPGSEASRQPVGGFPVSVA